MSTSGLDFADVEGSVSKPSSGKGKAKSVTDKKKDIDDIDQDDWASINNEIRTHLELPDRMSDIAAQEIWEKIFKELGIRTTVDKRRFKCRFAAQVALATSSTTQNFSETITVGGNEYELNSIVNSFILPNSQYRRFWRADCNIEFVAESLKYVDEVIDRVKHRAEQRGIPTDHYRAVCDLAAYFKDLTAGEKSWIKRASGRKTAVNEVRDVNENPGLVDRLEKNVAPDPTDYYNN